MDLYEQAPARYHTKDGTLAPHRQTTSCTLTPYGPAPNSISDAPGHPKIQKFEREKGMKCHESILQYQDLDVDHNVQQAQEIIREYPADVRARI
jgi:hypothetical protein